jgi:hypothetical protein
MTTDSRQRIIGLNDGLPLAGDHDELVLYDEMDTAMRYFDLPQDEGEYARVECFVGRRSWRTGGGA